MRPSRSQIRPDYLHRGVKSPYARILGDRQTARSHCHYMGSSDECSVCMCECVESLVRRCNDLRRHLTYQSQTNWQLSIVDIVCGNPYIDQLNFVKASQADLFACLGMTMPCSHRCSRPPAPIISRVGIIHKMYYTQAVEFINTIYCFCRFA